MSNMKDQAGREAPACVRCTSGTPDGERLARAVALYGTPSKALRAALRLLDTSGDDKVPYAAVTPAAKSAHALRMRVANLEAALERAERERDHFRDAWAKAQVRLDCGADATEAVREERAAVLRYLQHLPDVCVACCDAAVSDAIDAIEDGLHRPGGGS